MKWVEMLLSGVANIRYVVPTVALQRGISSYRDTYRY